ncbi:hypothetical protein [Sphaerimonospora mesophila]|uniref:hypothetical protein n=1 Tax=Sphaerimonospora mesophila TaxID=37483 RepID=UPI0006E2AB6A
MSVYHVRLIEAYAPGADHPWSVIRSVVSAESSPCLAPVLVRLGSHRRRVRCGDRLPLHRQCCDCAPRIVVIEVRRITA